MKSAEFSTQRTAITNYLFNAHYHTHSGSSTGELLLAISYLTNLGAGEDILIGEPGWLVGSRDKSQVTNKQILLVGP